MISSPARAARRLAPEAGSQGPARARGLALLVAAGLVVLAGVARADEGGPRTRRAAAVLEDSERRAAYAWQPAWVQHPVAVTAVGVPAALRELAALAAPSGAQLRGPVRIGPRTAVMLRLEALGTARVRLAAGADAELRFLRVSGEAGAAWTAAEEQPAKLSPGTWLLEQPPGGPSYWLVAAAREQQVVLETVQPRTGDLIWEHAIAAALAWVDEGGPVPPLPAVHGAEEARRELLADAEIAAEIGRLDPMDEPLRQAVAAWRAAAAVQRIDALRRPIRPAFALERRPRALADATPLPELPGWQRVRGERRAVWTLTGPGVLWIEARSVGAGTDGALRVHAAGRRLGSAALRRPVVGREEGELGPEAAAVGVSEGTGGGAPSGVSQGIGGGARSGVSQGTGGGAPSGVSQGTGVSGDGGEGAAGSRGVAPARRWAAGGGGAEDSDFGGGAADGDAPELAMGLRLAAAVGAPVGPRAALQVALAPGSHDYTIELDGADAVLLLRVGQRNERLAGLLRREDVAALLRGGRRALAASASPRAGLVDALLAAVEGRPAPQLRGGEASPALALARSCLAAEAEGLELAARVDLARTLARRARRAPAGALAWRARQRGLDLLEGTGEAALARTLVGPRPAEAPVELLERLARQIGGPAVALRSPAVALLELARRRAPLDPRLRAAYRDHWRAGTRWAALRADESGGAAWTWIEPWTPSDDRAPGTRALWRWPVGLERTLVAPPMPGRAALLRMYVKLAEGTGGEGALAEADVGGAGGGETGLVEGTGNRASDGRGYQGAMDVAGGSELSGGTGAEELSGGTGDSPARGVLGAAGLSLAVGARVWHGVALAGLETWRAALPTGSHRVRMTAPAGTRLWSSLPPAEGGPPDAHLLRMWPAAGGSALRFLLPAGAEPGFVRVELRAVGDRTAPQAARVYLARDDGDERAVDLWLPAQAPEVVPVDAPAGVGGRATIVVPIGPDTRTLRVRVAEGAPQLAIAASIRATRGDDEPAATSASRARDELPIDRLAQLSAAIVQAPADIGLRLDRAELLLDLDQPGYALVDWREVTAGGPLSRPLTVRATALAERLDALDAPDSIDLAIPGPALVEPALAAAIGPDRARRDRLLPAIAAARADGPAAGLRALDRLGLDSEPRWRGLAEAGPGDRSGGTGGKDGARDSPEGTGGDGSEDRSGGTGGDGSRDRSGGTGGSGSRDSSRGTGPETAPGGPAAAGAGELSGGTGSWSAESGALVAAAALRASWLDAQAQPGAAARVWARLAMRAGLWQAGLRGVRSYLTVLDAEAPTADGAGLAYGLALSLQPLVRTPALQRLATVAATRSRWSRVGGSERDAGSEALQVPRLPSLPSPNAAVRQALMVTPWDPQDATLLRPGYATVLELQRAAAGPLAVDLWCQTVRPDLAGAGPPRVRVVLDGAVVIDEPVAVEVVGGAAIEAVPAGGHRLEVGLDAASRGQLCSVRLRDELGPVGSLRPTRWRVARARSPAEVVVLGPTMVAIEARALIGRGGPAAPTTVQVSIAEGDGPFVPRGVITVEAAEDPRAQVESSRTIRAGAARSALFNLPEAGPQRVLLQPTSGAVLVRLQQRLDGEPTPVPRPPIRTLDLGLLVDTVAPIGLPPAALPPIASPPLPRRFGTVWAELRGGVDDLEQSDDLRPRAGTRTRLGYARELLARRLWIAATPELRTREGTAPAGGGGLALQAVFPRVGLRTRLAGVGLTQAFADRQAWTAGAELYVDRLTWVAPRWQVLPSLGLSYRHVSLTPAQAAVAPVHPQIFTPYAAAHPFALRPGFEARWQPLQDARVFVATDLVPNSDFRGLDQWNLRGGLLGAVALVRRVVPEFALTYEASLRLRDADRRSSFVQSRLAAAIGLAIWTGQAARVVLGASDTLYAAAPFPLRNVFQAWLRVDLVFGRALRDYGPLDLSFRPVREHRLWTGEGGSR
ncbi:hypothetical protein [Nannocystis sp.]|uniref:hypothetical protein n=1 Tax=Nannocystis sp. TaxID=1962667 RepID=UPI0025F5C557|nr:hypothetical protein [Nannocystis sp.]MBK7826146.1 hypothetical protein [Nannocystis sp.]